MIGDEDDFFDGETEIVEDLASFQEQDLRIFKAITTDNRLALDFANNFDSNIFLGKSKDVGKEILSYIKTYKTLPTKRVILDKCKDSNELTSKIEDLFDILPSIDFRAEEYQYDLDKLRQSYAETKFNALKDNLRFENQKTDIDKTMADVEQAIKDIKKVRQGSKKSSYTHKGIDEYLPEFQKEYVNKLKDPTFGRGILTGFSFLDYVTNGLQPAELFIVAAESGGGKSIWLNNMAINMWMQQNTISITEDFAPGCNILYFSLEMPYRACFRRTLCRLADIPIYGVRDAKLTKAETESLNLASKFIRKFSKRFKFEIVDIPRGISVDQIEERFLEAKTRFNSEDPIAVFIDYLGLMEDDTVEGDDWLALGKIAGRVHEFGRVYNVPVATAVQLNRAAKGKQSEPSDNVGMHRIGRSSLIMHHANIGVQIESRKDEWMRDTLLYHLIKNRDGEMGKHEIMKKFANASIFDVPYTPPDRDDYGAYMNGFGEDEDISEQVAKMLGLSS